MISEIQKLISRILDEQKLKRKIELDVLQAQVDLTTARTNEVEALYNHTVALASLRKAMGVADAFAPAS